MTEQIVIILIVVAVLVVLDGLRRKFGERRDRVVIKLDKKLPRSDMDEDELFKSELPNGGARTLPRHTEISRPEKPAPKLKSLSKRREQVKPGAVPVLLDAVELEEEQIEHTNVFADTSSTPAGELADYMDDEHALAPDSIPDYSEEDLDDPESEKGGTMGIYEDRMENELEEIIEGLDDDFPEPSGGLSRAGNQNGKVEDDEADEDEDEFWDEDWEDDEVDDEVDDEADEDELDDLDDGEEFEVDEDDDEDDEEELPADFGDYEDDEEQYRDKQTVSGRIEPTFGEESERRPGIGASFLSKKDQGELFREDTEARSASQAPAPDSPQEVIIINVMAKPGAVFGGYELLPILQLQGLRLGDMSIFHKHSGSNSTGSVIFSMANMVKPGTFDLATMDTFTTPGVCFFLQLPNKFGNMACFDQMLTAANALKHSLHGELKDENRSVFTRQTIEHSRQRIRDFELKLLARK